MLPNGAGTCPANTTPVFRLYNNGVGGAPNHRFTTSATIRQTMINQGWTPEGSGIGVSLCADIAVAPPVNVPLAKSNALVGGTWYFAYTFGASYIDPFVFNRVEANTGAGSADQPYNVWGVNQFNETVLASWSISRDEFVMLSHW
jgi:hypothetical protein